MKNILLFVALGVAFASANAQSYFEFDFQHDEYTDCYSGKDPCFYPVGWSKDGKFMYKERYCEGTGCYSAAIIVRDLMTNTNARYEHIDTRSYNRWMGMHYMGYMWEDSAYRNTFMDILDEFNIIPVNAHKYYTSDTVWGRNSNSGFYVIEMEVRQDGDAYEVVLVYPDGFGEYSGIEPGDTEVIYRGEVGKNDSGDRDSVFFAGYFRNEINGYAAIAVMHKKYDGYDGGDYGVELVGFEVPILWVD